MPFFQPATFYAPAQVDSNAFSNLFQLINDFDGYQRAQRESGESACKHKQQPKSQPKPQSKPQPAQKKQEPESKESQEPKIVYRHPFEEFLSGLQHAAAEAQRATPLPAFSPRFDVRETQDTYELHGELAGVDRSNISLEFTEPQTLVVSGKIERNYSSRNGKEVPALENTPEAMADDDDAASVATGGARTPTHDEEFTEVASHRSASPARSHRATVVDEEEEAALERGQILTNNDKTTVATTPAPVAVAPTTPAAPTEKFWYKERAIGQFKREFNFPVPVDSDKVHASLENGILSVSVPKSKRQVRRIAVL